MIKTKQCKDCGRTFPETREYFGQNKNTLSSGKASIKFRNSCRECMAARTAKYRKENPERVKASVQARVDQVANAGGSYDEQDIASIRKALGDRCRFCDAPLNKKGHVEHLCPVTRGGTSYPRNLTLSCEKCNLAKTNKTLPEFLVWRKERHLNIREIALTYEKPDIPNGSAGRRKT